MQRLLFILIGFTSLPVMAQSQENTNLPANNNSNTLFYNSNSNSNIHLDTTNYNLNILEETESGDKMKAEKKVRPAAVQRKEGALKIEDAEMVPAADSQVPATLRMQEQFQSNQLNSSRQYSRRSASPVEQMNMDQSVKYYQQAAPDAFETHLFTYLAGHYDIALYPELQAAAAIDAKNTEVIRQEAAYFIITEETEEAVGKIRELVKDDVISPGQLSYANDLLVSGQQNSTIVTHGFADMLSAYYVQNEMGVRKDVQLISLDLMQSEAYRAGWETKGFALPGSSVIDTAYLAEFCKLNAERALQLSLTIPRDYFNGIKSKLYPVGLTFQYSETPVDSYSKNLSLWDSEMKKELVAKAMNDSGDQWSSNYLLMMITLSKQLKELNELKKAQVIDKAILGLGTRNNAEGKVKKYTR